MYGSQNDSQICTNYELELKPHDNETHETLGAIYLCR
jgi:hypothetical protein